jgi:hypothetical protein
MKKEPKAMKTKIAFAALVLFLASGCASVSVHRFNERVYPPTNPAKIVILPSKPAGQPDFIELGEITVTGANEWAQVEKIFRSKGAEMGADAVYVFNQKQETREYVTPSDCFVHHGYYYPYQHFGWRRYHPSYYYPRGYYYCYGYQNSIETATYISAVGIAIRYATR